MELTFHHPSQALHDANEGLRLSMQLLDCRGAFFGLGRDSLCYLLHLRNRFADLIGAAGLLHAA